MKAILILLLCSTASADTYKFDHTKGHPYKTPNMHSCASPVATKRLLDFVGKDLRVTPGRGQMTVTTDGTVSAADSVIGDVGKWIIKTPSGATLTVIVDIDTFGWCTESTTCASHAPELHVSIIQRFNGEECVEAWRGDGVKL
jgi:hypothetical protein